LRKRVVERWLREEKKERRKVMPNLWDKESGGLRIED